MQYTLEELRFIIEEHKKWLACPSDGACADFSGADLSGADLACADLTGAELRGAEL